MGLTEIRAPWTPDQVATLNRFQHQGRFHPFTCGNPGHTYHSPVLVAHEDGWHCSESCGYRQTWAPSFMFNPAATSQPFEERPGPPQQGTRQAVRAIFALKSPAPEGSEHYRSGWDDGLEAAMDAVEKLPQPVTAVAFRERLAQRLAAEAYACDGINCGQTEQECWDSHEIRWSATSNGIVHLDGSSVAIAAVAVEVCRELGLLPPE